MILEFFYWLTFFAHRIWLESAQRSIILQDVLGKVIYHSTTAGHFLFMKLFINDPPAVGRLFMHTNYSLMKFFHNLHNPVDIGLHTHNVGHSRLHIEKEFERKLFWRVPDKDECIMQEQDKFMFETRRLLYPLENKCILNSDKNYVLF